RRGRAGVTRARRSVAGSVLELAAIVAAALGLALLIQAFVVKPYRIPSGSMEPTLHIGQRILVDRLATRFGAPHLGEIVVFHPPTDYQQGCLDSRAGQNQAGENRAMACDLAWKQA